MYLRGFLSVFDLFFPLRYDTYKNCTLSRSFEKDSDGTNPIFKISEIKRDNH